MVAKIIQAGKQARIPLNKSDTPRRAGGLMSGAASKAVHPFTRRRVHMKFFVYLTKQRNASHIPQMCRSPNWVN
jgi:hypothetical protein